MARKDKTQLRIIIYDGVEYVAYKKDKYYQNRHDKHLPRLHQQIYIDNFGPIPAGYHVHHIDGNTENNSVSNLTALPAGEHTKETFRQLEGFERGCESCGKKFIAKIKTRAKYCSKRCAHREWAKKNSAYLKEYNRLWESNNINKVIEYRKRWQERRKVNG